MIPHDIDAGRFEYLLLNGTTANELRDFFKAQQRALLMAGEKVQNLPSSDALRIAAIKRFSPEAHEVLRSWFSKQAAADSIAASQVVPRLRAVEELGVSLNKDEHGSLMSCALRQLYVDPPPSDLVGFLRTPISSERKNDSGPTTTGADAPSVDDWVRFARAASGEDGDQLTHPTLLKATRLLQATQQRDGKTLADDPSLVAAFSMLSPNVIASEPRESVIPPSLPGLRARPPEIRQYDDSFDYTTLAVVATRFSHREGTPWFAVVEAFLDERGLFTLPREDIALAMPKNGEVVIHKDRGLPIPPVGEACLYQVERIQTEYAARVRATDVLENLIPVIHVPYPTSEAHLIRDYIAKRAGSAGLRSALFVSADNVCMRTRDIPLSRVTSPEHDWLLDTWPQLDGFELSSATYVLGPLPPAEGTLDCAPLAKVAKRLLKAAADRAAIPLTKAHREELTRILGEEALNVSSLTRKRLIANLALIDHSGDDYKNLIDVLLQDSAIRKSVDDGVNTAIAQRSADKAAEAQKVDNLKRESKRLAEAIRELEKEREEKVRGIKAAVHKAFGVAAKRELEALGDLSLLTALYPVSSPSDRGVVQGVEDRRPIAESITAPSNEPLSTLVQSFGLPEEKASDIAEALALAARCGAPIVVQGAAAAILGERLGKALAKRGCRNVEIQVGLVEPVLPREWLIDANCDVLVLQNANTSDVSLYSPDLIRTISQRAVSASTADSISAVVMAAASGPASLSWPEEVVMLAAKIDLARVGQTDELPEGEQSARAIHPLQRVLLTKAERTANQEDCSERAFRTLKKLILG